ncbi:unnamed protein product [Leptidea sinapis]|uniref:Uncharacterized protein n=1 Tax=Leptidea sinapis TaxID=189913 RepID=A0A5E4QCD8_9NEOP|nr:unnamed protein product [Leptidea sinapis]
MAVLQKSLGNDKILILHDQLNGNTLTSCILKQKKGSTGYAPGNLLDDKRKNAHLAPFANARHFVLETSKIKC